LAAVHHINKSNAAGTSKRLYNPALQESVDWTLLSSICHDPNLRISVFK